MIETLSNLFRSVMVLTPDDLLQCVYLCLNQLAPAYEGVELGMGETLLMRAIAQATGTYILLITFVFKLTTVVLVSHVIL